MSQLISFLDQHMIQALGWTFIHTLWQGCVIVLVMIFALQRIPQKDAVKRYTVATASMISMLVAALATFMFLYYQPGQAEAVASSDIRPVLIAAEPSTWTLTGWLSDNLAALVAIWVIGVALLSMRLLVGMAYIYRLKQTSSDLTYNLGNKAKQIADALSYSRPLVIAESALVKIPVVVGYLKPMVLFPIGAVNQLTSEEVEAVLAHEIAHLVRNDFIHNLIQSVIEVIFYYHPAVWWISAVVRAERENCCDDLAIQVCGNSFTYARALVRLQEVGRGSPALALPFSGSKNHLLERVKRILNQPQNKSNLMEKITATSLLLLCLIFASFSDGSADTNERTYVEVPKLVTHYNAYLDYAASTDTVIPGKLRTVIHEETDGKSYELEMENGEITKLRVDGEEIPADRYNEYRDEVDMLRSNIIEVPAPPAPPEIRELPPMPPMPPMPNAAPLPPSPPHPPMPPAPAPAPDFGMGEFEFEFEMDDINIQSGDFEFAQDMDIVFEVAPEMHQGHTETKRTKSVIIRERDEDGSLHYRVEGENSNILIDAAEGIAIIDGQEVEIDSDSIIVIEETQTMAPGLFEYKVAPGFKLDSAKWTKQWEGAWDQEKWAKEWKENFDKEEWATYWQENKENWLRYSKEYGQKMKELKSSPEWEQYMKEMQEYKEQLHNQKLEEIILFEKDGAQQEFIIRSRDRARELRADDVEQLKREIEVRVREARESEKSKDTEKEENDGHSSLEDRTLHQYVITTQGENFKWHSKEGVNIQHISDVKDVGYVTLTAELAEMDSESGEVRFTGNGGVIVEVPEGDVHQDQKIERVVLVTAKPLVVDGEVIEIDNLEEHILEVKVEGKAKPVDNSSAKAKKAKF